ncbi:PAS domain-containing sensor histidine kinase [Halovivax gelatinilyticus]|uniref:PAS domain-containing sensor histidine kinase n=1 Tax=Halovivax gelatinilyticus TaxID=2961597 RepID=UPI0020CA90CB|nr:PAS domain S-box protein [Halovivax gelatinilyticus]
MTNRSGDADAGFWREPADESVALARYRTLVNTVDDGIYQVDADGRFVAVNDVICELTGYDRSALLDEHVSIILPDADVEAIQRAIELRLAAERPIDETFEITVETADDDELYCELRASLLFEDGAFEGTVGIVRDVTSDRRTARRLTERERELGRERRLVEQIFQTSPIGIQVLTADGEIVRMNDRLADILEIANEATYSPDDRPVFDESGEELSLEDHPFARALETGEAVYDDVLQVELPDGERRWLRVSAAPLEAEGDVDRVVTTGEDITPLKSRQRELESELEEIFGRISDAFFAVDEAFRFTHVNERAGEILQRSEAQLLGEELWKVFPEAAESAEIREAFHDALETQEPTHFEVHVEGIDSWVEANLYPSETGVSVYFRDVTERKAHERRLEEAKAQLEASNERLEQFAYAASHDLQEPLRMVSSYLSLLERRYADALDDEAQEFIEYAVDGAGRMREMIDGLLAYSRIETQGRPLEPVELNAVVDDVLADLQLQLDDADVRVDELPHVEGDGTQLRQLFQNLVENAAEYSGEDRPTIRIEAEDRGEECLVSIEDDGIGLGADDQTRIFELFQRLHTLEEHEGTGIGLALCRRIVERHGGEIWVDSDPGGGSTFYVTLPAVDERS